MAELFEFITQILRYVSGVLIVALVTAAVKLYLDMVKTKADVCTLQEQRKADLIERNDLLTIAQAIKNESKTLKVEFDMKLKDVMHHFAIQQKEDREMMKDMFHEVNLTLTKLNSTIEVLQSKSKE